MAIYKPSNCLPFLSCFDLTKEQDITCELNTSNEVVTGYKIKILDSNNDVIFEGMKFDSINPEGYENSGLNNTTLTLPLIVDGAPINSNTIGYTDGKFVAPAGATFISDKFSNGYINQPYKWIITLEQGNLIGQKADKYYDMMITQGKILGSNRNRIQSYLSNNIYADYFIQLDNVEKRVMIDSYDHTYGYLYPQENKFTDEEIASAKYFKVYKSSNDPDVIAAGSQVAFAVSKSMDSIMIEGKTSNIPWGDELTYPNYFKQTFEGLSVSYKKRIACSLFDSKVSGYLGIGTIIMVKGENEGASAYNGIFKLNSIDETQSNNNYNLTLTWLRSTPGDTWANLVSTVFYIQNGSEAGKRYQVKTDSQTVGTINQTPVVFVPEQAVELYTDSDKSYDGNDKTKGIIFKNTKDEIYIRPFVGITDGMRLSYLKNNETQYKNVDITSINTETWKINGDFEEILTSDVDQYKILSYFKVSDESPFYAYAQPQIDIKYDGETITSVSEINTVTQRTATFQGVFSQENNKTWVNYQWIINDLSDGSVEKSEKFYSGDLTYTVSGLQNGHIYQVALIIEDEFGSVYGTYSNIQIELELLSSTTTLTITPDCLTQSYIIEFLKSGVVVPSVDPQIFYYRTYTTDYSNKEVYNVKEKETSSNYLPLAVNGDSIEIYDVSYPTLPDGSRYLSISNIEDGYELAGQSSLMEYKQIKLEEGFIGSIPAPSENVCTFNSKHKLNKRFNGTIIEYKFDTDDTIFDNVEADISIIIPPVTKKNANGEIVAYSDDSLAYYVQYSVEDESRLKSLDYVVINNQTSNQLFFVKDLEEEIGRYNIIATYVKRYPGNNNILLAFRALKWTDKRDDVKIVSAWVKPGTTANDDFDYLDTDIVYDTNPSNSNYRHIRGEGVVNSRGKIGYILSSEEKNDYSYWNDFKTVIVKQADDTNINVFSSEYNYWNDKDENGDWLYWYDKGSEELYKQTNINKNEEHTGRQFIADNYLTFNLAIRNFDNTNSNVLFDPQTDFAFNLFKEVVTKEEATV